ncbi:MAG TPA: hypothetical protein VEC19_08500 [Usitatibacter sp.]|nr:hypothetical protein [Usitatibacter sp.]
MDSFAIFLAAALAAPAPAEKLDFDRPTREIETSLHSPRIQDMLTAAMAQPYGVSRMPCRAMQLQPLKGWKPAREPSGKIAWIEGPVARAKWSGIYGTCYIETPAGRAALEASERAALECECNGWLPQGVGRVPLP